MWGLRAMLDYEVEMKYSIDGGDIPRIEGKVRGMGFEFEGETHQRDTYFRSPSGCALRLREEDGSARLTAKGGAIWSDGGAKSRREIEVTLPSSDASKLGEILELVGIPVRAIVRKVRRQWRTGGAIICVDSIEGLGHFLEVEVIDRDREGAEARVEEIGRSLDLPPASRTKASYLEMFEEGGGERLG
ncbi:MAG: class IV adenylate cyclase [bacterium]